MLNHIVLMGRLTRDPELRRTGSGVAVASFTLAVDRDYAAFGELSFDVTDQLTLTGGARLYNYKNSLVGFFGYNNPGFSGNVLNAIGPYADLEGNVSVNLLPGTITNVVLGKKVLKGRTGGITVHDAHVKVDACGGAVAIRFFSTVTIDTDRNDDSVNAYGDILQL